MKGAHYRGREVFIYKLSCSQIGLCQLLHSYWFPFPGRRNLSKSLRLRRRARVIYLPRQFNTNMVYGRRLPELVPGLSIALQLS